ncbi:MAG: polysaccharide deacetylase family protein [Verrucomicrobia bacterium]|nr:polysaccharide deacetylase family protein [Verrucomicrobiota bacterium]
MKPIIYRIAGLLAWHGASGKRNACDSIAILMLHGVHDLSIEKRMRPPANSMPIAGFVRGVQTLRRRYQIVSLDAAVAMLSGRAEWKPRCVVLTFDDSLHCLLPTAAKWLAASKLNATFFLSTEVIDHQRPYWWKRLDRAVAASTAKEVSALLPNGSTFRIDPALGLRSVAPLKTALKLLPAAEIETVVTNLEEQFGGTVTSSGSDDPYARILSWPEVLELASLGMTIGSHTVTHPNLAILAPEQVRTELIESRERIQMMAGVPCEHLCYPYGTHSPSVCAMARDVGYRSAVTPECPGWNYRDSDLFALRRFAMPSDSWRVTPLLSGISGFRSNSK